MMCRLATSVLCLALVATGAACGSRDVTPEEKVLKFLTASERLAHAFEYTDETLSGKAVVTGEIEDDLRARALLKIDESEVFEEYISDDTISIRVADPSKVPAAQGSEIAGSKKVAQTLQSGQWVSDPGGAPPVLAPRDRSGVIQVGENFILDSIYAFQYFRRSISEAAGVVEFNKDSPDYFPREDPFDHPNEDAGVTRFDLRPPNLPARSTRGSSGSLPGIAHFRKMSFYVRNGKVIKVAEEINFESHKDFKRALRGEGPQYPLQLLAAVRAGQAREPIRPRKMFYDISRLGDEDLEIVLPTAALTAPLRGVFGPKAVADAPGRETSEGPPPPEISTSTVIPAA